MSLSPAGALGLLVRIAIAAVLTAALQQTLFVGVARAQSTVPPPSHSSSCGPQRGHAMGCAWKRRSSGSWYSREHSGHIANFFIDVFARSYGSDSMIEKRGPQLVQLVNG